MLDLIAFKAIASCDKHIWVAFSELNKIFNREFNTSGIEYELTFRVIIEKRDEVRYKLNGVLHRTGAPAVAYDNGESEEWWFRGKLHRIGGPARTSLYGGVSWYYMGLLHNENGPAYIANSDRKKWYIMGKRHRIGGPAVTYGACEKWYIDDKLHRIDGPAITKPYVHMYYTNGNLKKVVDIYSGKTTNYVNGRAVNVS